MFVCAYFLLAFSVREFQMQTLFFIFGIIFNYNFFINFLPNIYFIIRPIIKIISKYQNEQNKKPNFNKIELYLTACHIKRFAKLRFLNYKSY